MTFTDLDGDVLCPPGRVGLAAGRTGHHPVDQVPRQVVESGAEAEAVGDHIRRHPGFTPRTPDALERVERADRFHRQRSHDSVEVLASEEQPGQELAFVARQIVPCCRPLLDAVGDSSRGRARAIHGGLEAGRLGREVRAVDAHQECGSQHLGELLVPAGVAGRPVPTRRSPGAWCRPRPRPSPWAP
jgi:hypothetical protein